MSSASIVAAFAVLFVVAVNGHSAGSDFWAGCPTVTPFANLESTRLAGEWFGVWSKHVNFQDPQIRCVKGELQVDDAGSVTISLKFIKSSTNDRDAMTTVGTPIDGNKAKLRFVFPATPLRPEDKIILDTDYDHYLIWLTCRNTDGQSGYTVVVISRQASLSPALTDRVKEALRASNLDDKLNEMSQSNC